MSFASVQPIGFGMMNFTCLPNRKFTQDEFNGVFKEIVVGGGASLEHPMFINGGEFYGVPDRHEGLKLLGGFFAAHPEFADKIVLSIKAGTTPHWAPDTSAANLNAAVAAIDEHLQPLYAARRQLPKRLDIFCVARVGEEPIEEVVQTLQSHVGSKISGICLSEIAAPTLKRAIAAGKIAAIEIEFSMFHPDAISNGLFELCAQNDIAVIAYSPLGKGVLVGKKLNELDDGDFRKGLDKFNDAEAVSHNNQLVEYVQTVAKEQGLTPAQVALSWIVTESRHNGNPQVVPIPGGTNAPRQLSNFQSKPLSPEIFAKINAFLHDFKTAGHRYNAALDQFTSK